MRYKISWIHEQSLNDLQSSQLKLEVSMHMKHGTIGPNWSLEMHESSALIGAILSIIHPQLYEQGVPLGEKDSTGIMTFPGLDISIRYNPSTIVGIAGKVVSHGAAFEGGERGCISYYMHNKVYGRLGIPVGTWINTSIYES